MPGFYLGTHSRKKEREPERLGGPSNIDAPSWERRAEGGWVRATGVPGSFRKTSAVRAVCSHQELA